MKQEDKELLLKDLCARLPYGVKGNYQNSDDELLRKVTIMYWCLEPNGMVMTGDIKPYLFPLSSMTEEQKKFIKWKLTTPKNDSFEEDLVEDLLNNNKQVIQYCYKNHFDINDLIEKGLAIDATNLNIY